MLASILLIVSNFIVQAIKGEPLTLYGDGSQTRSFCYVDDLIEGMIRLMNGEPTGPINIGNPGEFTIQQLAELVRDQIKPLQRQPVIDLARSELNWEPNIALKAGLKPTMEWFRQAIHSPT